jgi:hypothetical protein
MEDGMKYPRMTPENTPVQQFRRAKHLEQAYADTMTAQLTVKALSALLPGMDHVDRHIGEVVKMPELIKFIQRAYTNKTASKIMVPGMGWLSLRPVFGNNLPDTPHENAGLKEVIFFKSPSLNIPRYSELSMLAQEFGYAFLPSDDNECYAKCNATPIRHEFVFKKNGMFIGLNDLVYADNRMLNCKVSFRCPRLVMVSAADTFAVYGTPVYLFSITIGEILDMEVLSHHLIGYTKQVECTLLFRDTTQTTTVSMSVNVDSDLVLWMYFPMRENEYKNGPRAPSRWTLEYPLYDPVKMRVKPDKHVVDMPDDFVAIKKKNNVNANAMIDRWARLDYGRRYRLMSIIMLSRIIENVVLAASDGATRVLSRAPQEKQSGNVTIPFSIWELNANNVWVRTANNVFADTLSFKPEWKETVQIPSLMLFAYDAFINSSDKPSLHDLEMLSMMAPLLPHTSHLRIEPRTLLNQARIEDDRGEEGEGGEEGEEEEGEEDGNRDADRMLREYNFLDTYSNWTHRIIPVGNSNQ